MDKSIIIELMAHHYAGRVSSQILIGLFGAISHEDKVYISENGYELVDYIPETEHMNLDQVENFDLDHVSSCFEAYINSDDPHIIDYCFSIFNRFVERCNRQVLFHKFRQIIFHNPRHLRFHSPRHFIFHTCHYAVSSKNDFLFSSL